ncbi:MAG: hypothetical protein ACLTFB_01420 [Candidatus Phytoplasma pyri]
MDSLNNSNVITIKKLNSEKFSSKNNNNDSKLRKFEKKEKNNKTEIFIFKDKLTKREIAKQIYVDQREFVLEEDIIKNEYEISLNPKVKINSNDKKLKFKKEDKINKTLIVNNNNGVNDILENNLTISYFFDSDKDFFENINNNKDSKIYLIILYKFNSDSLKNNDNLLKKMKALKPAENKINHKLNIYLKFEHE